MTRAPMEVTSSQAREVLGGRVGVGTEGIQCAPLNRSGRAPSMPFTSEPAMGCPGTKFSGCGRTRSAKAVMRAFVEAVSVTMPR